MDRIRELAAMIFPPYIPQEDLTLMIEGIFQRVDSTSNGYHIDNPVFSWELTFSCLLVLTGSKTEVELRLKPWLNKLDTHQNNPTDQDSDSL